MVKKIGEKKKGQITIFIIVAIIIIVAIVLIFVLYNRIKPEPGGDIVKDPEANIEQCVNIYVEEAVDKIIERGGYTGETDYLNMDFCYPEGYYLQGCYEDLGYLCHTSLNDMKCNPTEPVLFTHLEKEIYDYIEADIETCFESLKEGLDGEGYSVNLGDDMGFSVQLVSGEIRTNIQRDLTARKSGQSEEFEEFNIKFLSRLYDVAEIVNQIINEEVLYDGSDHNRIMIANTWVEIEKFQTGDGNTIYTIKDTRTNKEFVFAVRGSVLDTP